MEHNVPFFFFAASVALDYPPFSHGTALSSVQCRGTEARLVDCLSDGVLDNTMCRDAGVRCLERSGIYM